MARLATPLARGARRIERSPGEIHVVVESGAQPRTLNSARKPVAYLAGFAAGKTSMRQRPSQSMTGP